MTRKKKYSKEFKLDAVNLVFEQNYTKADAARSLEIKQCFLDGSLLKQSMTN